MIRRLAWLILLFAGCSTDPVKERPPSGPVLCYNACVREVRCDRTPSILEAETCFLLCKETYKNLTAIGCDSAAAPWLECWSSAQCGEGDAACGAVFDELSRCTIGD